jgi:hypothetical protein
MTRSNSARRLQLSRDLSQRSLESDIKKIKGGTKPRKSVRFNKQVRIREHDHVLDYSDEEYFAVWMAPHEVQLFKEEAYTTLKMYKKGKLPKDSKDLCIRGLEPLIDGRADQRQAQGINAVMKTQSMTAHFEGDNKVEMIAQVYRRVSAESKSLAEAMGREDVLASKW